MSTELEDFLDSFRSGPSQPGNFTKPSFIVEIPDILGVIIGISNLVSYSYRQFFYLPKTTIVKYRRFISGPEARELFTFLSTKFSYFDGFYMECLNRQEGGVFVTVLSPHVKWRKKC